MLLKALENNILSLYVLARPDRFWCIIDLRKFNFPMILRQILKEFNLGPT